MTTQHHTRNRYPGGRAISTASSSSSQSRPRGGHVFVDESKAGDYLVVAAVVLPDAVGVTRQRIRSLVLPGQRRLHMKKERNSRRGQIVTALTELGVTATIYNAKRRSDELVARRACLQSLVEDAASQGHRRLVLEQDDSLVWWDRQRLIEITRAVGCRDSLQYEHLRAEAELLLGIPDAIAWCWAHGGMWRDRIKPLVVETKTV